MDRPEHLDALRRIYVVGQRIAHVTGDFGTGKTTLVRMFIAQNSDLFPGGTTYVCAEELMTGRLDVLSVLPNASTIPSLLTLDELEIMVDSCPRVLPRDALNALLRQYPQLRILASSQRPVLHLPGEGVVRLGDLTDAEVGRLLTLYISAFAQSGASDRLSMLPLRSVLASVERKSPRAVLVAAYGLLARGFHEPGLYGPDGKPLERGSVGYRQVVEVVSQVNDVLLRRLRRRPELLHSLSPRVFEKIVAELLSRFGFDVSLTAASGDGGFDMYAARRDAVSQFLYLVECKRYVPPNKVGVELVRALHGTVEAMKATAGLLVTTSRFTSGAEDFQRATKYRIQLHDYLAVQSWLGEVSGHK